MASREAKMSRFDWLRLVMRYGRRKNRIPQLFIFILFEAYYRLCMLMGYPARHFLDPLPEAVRTLRAGQQVLYIWPRLPLSIRLLDRVIPFGRVAHAECVPYTTDAASAAEAAGRRVEVVEITPGELKVVGG
jgi:hypothetical protein